MRLGVSNLEDTLEKAIQEGFQVVRQIDRDLFRDGMMVATIMDPFYHTWQIIDSTLGSDIVVLYVPSSQILNASLFYQDVLGAKKPKITDDNTNPSSPHRFITFGSNTFIVAALGNGDNM